MGKTYKQIPYKVLRHPHGHKRARIEGARKKAVPPSAWEDQTFDDQVYRFQKIAESLHEKGFSLDEIGSHLRKKYKVPDHHVKDILLWIVG